MQPPPQPQPQQQQQQRGSHQQVVARGQPPLLRPRWRAAWARWPWVRGRPGPWRQQQQVVVVAAGRQRAAAATWSG
jgi:hypothetical protein